eukprot:TRINITY_DN987_c0_g1_i1.p1 TRINITY_DN987_c0_g1~~TRINITY_DN987_c0_g1_i1.p1  ORF type:complete len:445 (+),score=157.22 TRINITY_DN987_c0_g1_i1:67-1401(+)
MRGFVGAGLLSAVAAAAAVDASSNPFAGKNFYVNPANQEEYDGSIKTASGKALQNLKLMRDVPSAYWLDVKAKVNGTDLRSLSGILADAAKKSPPELTVFIVYDLPNRDCHAKASNGEICCYKKADGSGLCDYDKSGDCAEGLSEYESEYVDPIAKVLKAHGNKSPVVLVVEPDSLPNLATNQGDPHCGNSATTAAYKQGISYAVKTLSEANPHVALYLDAAHGGWLGWDDNLQKYAALVKGMEITQYLRGFSTNVANYQPLGVQCPWAPQSSPTRNDYCLNNQHQSDECCKDPCRLESQWNQANNELNYAAALQVAMSRAVSGFEAHMIIDSGRNGVADMRAKCADWCNIRGAGAGVRPTTKVANSSIVDAYYWLKTPGESDGCTQKLPSSADPMKANGTCARYDSMCGSTDSIGSKAGEPFAPEAGKWFDYQVKMLAENAQL